MPAFDCPDCGRVFEALGIQRKQTGMLSATVGLCLLWQPAPDRGAAAEAPALKGTKRLYAAMGIVQDVSRHRHWCKPPDTPPDYWDMGFADSLDERVLEQV